jgi:hypothetical protein
MANGLLKKLALSTISALLGPHAKAIPTNWSSFRDITDSRVPVSYRGEYTSNNSTSPIDKTSGILYMISSGKHIPVGGFDMIDGQITESYFRNIGEAYTANTGIGANPNNTYETFWQVFYDSDGDGNYGLQDNGMFLDYSEALNDSEFSISNFTPYGSENPGSFRFTTPVPESATGRLALGGTALLAAGSRRRRKSEKYVSNKTTKHR